MSRPPRNPRRAYGAEGCEIKPKALATMREHGVRSVAAECQKIGCRHAGSVNVDHLPGDFATATVLGQHTPVCQPPCLSARA